MNGWNYRVMRHFDEEHEWFGIHEVYYEYDGSVNDWAVEAMEPHGESPSELCRDLAMMIAALTRPVLDYRDGKEIALVDHLAADIGAACREMGIELKESGTREGL